MKIYLSIPKSGHDISIQSKLARLQSELLELRGHTPMNPFTTQTAPEHLNEKETYAYYMGEDMKMLLSCDAIYMVDKKWRKSKGCSIEHNAAYVMDMDIFYDINDIPDESNH